MAAVTPMRFGIVTPTLNGERYFERCLDSIWSQRSPQVEIDHVVVDGGSTDRTVEVAHRYPSRVLVGRDGGMYEAVNRGMEVVEGDVVAYVNADDELVPGSLRTVARALGSASTPSWLCGGVEFIGSDGSSLAVLRMVPVSRRALLGMPWCPIYSVTVWARRAFFDRVGPFDQAYRQAGDCDWYVRAMALEQPLILPDVLARFRVHPGNLSLDRARMREEVALIRQRHGGGTWSSRLQGGLLRLRINLSNPGWLLSKKAGRLARARDQRRLSHSDEGA